jgi:zinc protease
VFSSDSSSARFTDSTPGLLATAVPRPVHHHELPNGLHLLILEDYSAPVVSIQYWIETGSIHEGAWLGSGLSHLLEHLMFKGTPTRGNSQMAQEIQTLGGHLNAYTSFDRTVYHVDLPSSQWRGALEILTDAMLHSTLPEEEFAREQEVIRREFAMGEDSPERQLSHLLFRTAYIRSPYRFPIIGHLDLFNQLTLENVRSYYQSRYVPQNMTLIVVGAVAATEIIAEAEALLAETPRHLLPDIYFPDEPPQQSPRLARQTFPTKVTRLALVNPVPGLNHDDIPALDILAMILGGGRSARLNQRCVEQQGLAEDIDAFCFVPPRQGLWGVEARCQPEQQEPLLAAVREEIARLQQAGPTPAELARAQRLSLLHQVHSLKTMAGQASSLGRGWLLNRDPHFSQHFLERLQNVSVDDVLRVGRLYLDGQRETRIELVPEKAAVGSGSGQQQTASMPQARLVGGGAPCRGLYVPSAKLPLVSFRAIFGRGLMTESPEKRGLGRLTAKLLLKGTQKRTAEALALEVEQLGGSMGSEGGNNTAAVSLELLEQDWERGLDLFLEILTEPRFTEKELLTEKRKQTAAWQVEQDQPMAVARQLVREAFFPGHPYLTSALGTPETLAGITLADVENYARRFYLTNELIVGSSGPVSPDQWFPRAAGRLAAVLQPASPPPSVPLPSGAELRRLEKIHEKEQAVLLFAYRTPSLLHPDHVPLTVLSEALSDLGSRLFIKIREALGLAYFVGTSEFQGTAASLFYFYVGTDPKKRKQVEAAMIEEIRQIAAVGLTEEELVRARAKLISQDQLASQNPAQTLASAGLDELVGLGYDFEERRQERIAKITLAEVNQAAKTYFSKDDYVFAVVSPE